MSKKTKEFIDAIWNKEAKKQLENELNFMSKEKIELPDGKDYLKIYAETHKTNEEIMQQEIERLNNIIKEAKEYIKEKTKNICFENDRLIEVYQILDKGEKIKDIPGFENTIEELDKALDFRINDKGE